MRVLVCGATGYLGGYVCQAAKRRGHVVRALARDAARLGAARPAVDEVVTAEATRPETLAGLCDGIDVVFSSLGNRTLRRRPTCWEVDEQANRNLLAAARGAGVRQFVFVSVLKGAEARARVPQIEARERVVDALRAGDLPWTVLRPSGFFNDLAETVAMARRGAVWVLDSPARFNPIHGADLAEVAVDSFGAPGALGAEIPAGGPDALTAREIAALAIAAVGRPAKVRALPLWALTAAAALIRPFNVNLASLLSMLTLFSDGDALTDRYGTHHLADFFRELAADRSGS